VPEFSAPPVSGALARWRRLASCSCDCCIRPLIYDHRLIIDTILYVLVSGCAWRLMPHDLALWDGAHRWFRHWSAKDIPGA
jgi:transposase